MLFGATASVTTVMSGGDALVSGTADNFVVLSGATMVLEFGGRAGGTVIRGPAGGAAGGYEFVARGAIDSGATLTGGDLTVSAGTEISATVSGGGYVLLTAGGVTSGTDLRDGIETVASGGIASDTIVSSGSLLIVDLGGTAVGTILESGGYLVTLSGGVATGNQSSGGSEISSGVLLEQPDTAPVIYPSIASDVTVSSLATEIVLSGGAASFTVVSSGGLQILLAGPADETTLSGGVQQVGSGIVVTSTTVDSGGSEIVGPGGVASFTTVSSGGSVVFSGGAFGPTGPVDFASANSMTVDSGASATVEYFANASATTVNSGGVETVYNGALDSGGTVNDGGTQVVSLFSLVSKTIVNSGGTQILATYGEAGGVTVSSGGRQFVSLGYASATTVLDGGYQRISSGGEAVATIVGSGGTEVVSSGGTAVSTTVDLGGMIDVAYLSDTGGGSASVNTSGMLTVSVGGTSYTQQLLGSYADEHFETRVGRPQRHARYGGAWCAVLPQRHAYPDGSRRGGGGGSAGWRPGPDGAGRGTRRRSSGSGGARWIVRAIRSRGRCGRCALPPGRSGRGGRIPSCSCRRTMRCYAQQVLIPIRHLINGTSIVQVPVDRVSYYHIELPRHDVVLAQGLPAESFLDMRDGSNYANRVGPVRLYPDFSARMWEAFGCARLVVTGPELAATRALVGRYAMGQEAA